MKGPQKKKVTKNAVANDVVQTSLPEVQCLQLAHTTLSTLYDLAKNVSL